MKAAIALAVVAFFASSAAVASPVCDSQAAEKKLAGAAKDSFLKKCEANQMKKDMSATCTTQAKEKKLAGAAMTSFVNKCVKDASAAAAPKKS